MKPGTLLDNRYEVIKELGSGTFAVVYLARHSSLLSLHAVKVLDEKLAADPDIRNRFLAEGRIQAQLRHPNVVSVSDIVTHPCAGLVLEYVEGPTLAEWIGERAGSVPTVQQVLALFLPVLSGVGAAHRQGIVHRDLKPDNILVSRDSTGKVRPMVGDFGIAKVVGGSLEIGKKKTQIGMRMGTLQYMSPEQVKGSQDLDSRSDIFALGAILYEVVTGKMAFDRDSEWETQQSIVAGTFEPPERIVGGLHPMFAACIRKALAVSPEERFQDCEAFHRTLALAEDPSATLPERPSRSAVVTQAPAPKTRTVPPPGAARNVPPQPPSTPDPYYGWQPAQQHGLIAPDRHASPMIAAFVNALFCCNGLGQVINGQVTKGILVFVMHVLACLICGPFAAVTWIIAIVDAWCIASKRANGHSVGLWEWF